MFLTNIHTIEGKGKIKSSALFAIEVLCCYFFPSSECPMIDQNPVLRMGRLTSGTWPPQMTWPENTAQEQADAGGASNLITVLGYQTQPWRWRCWNMHPASPLPAYPWTRRYHERETELGGRSTAGVSQEVYHLVEQLQMLRPLMAPSALCNTM